MPPLLETKNTELVHKRLLIEEVISQLRHFTKLYAVESLFIAGGYCRSLYINRLWDVNDIDVASAFEDQALQLGGLFASEVLDTTPQYYHRTGTAMVEYKSEFGSIKVEFQGSSISPYMYNEEVKAWMRSNNIDDVPLMHNIYGRDFTINSFIYSLHNGKLYDPTGKAEEDFKKKIIASLLPPDLLIKYNPLAILRAIRFSLKYGYHIEASLTNAMQEGTDILLNALSEDRIMKDVVKVLKLNGPDGLEMLKRYNLDRILLNSEIKDYLDLHAEVTNG